MRKILTKTLTLLTCSVLGACTAALVGGIWYLENRTDLDIWHTVKLTEEFTAASSLDSYADYLKLEERVFVQLDELIYARLDPQAQRPSLRYQADGAANPARWPRNWNRSYELPAENPRAGVLLLHGITDSPYSLHAVGRSLHAAGATVVGMRLPGHGTVPGELRHFTDADLIAATRLGVQHVRSLIGDRPLYLVGYSTGGALAIDYALGALEDEALPEIAGIVMISPAIGVMPAARFAVWQSRIGRLLGLPKLEWNDIIPEYDPFKYNSFAINAADVVYQLTNRISEHMERAREAGTLKRLPPILAFQSIVDATVSTPALIDGLLTKLPARGDELVLFDIDRTDRVDALLTRNPALDIRTAMSDGNLPFMVTLITNETPDTANVIARTQEAGSSARSEISLDMAWPKNVVSLSHVALPFPASDPLYGAMPPQEPNRLYLGNLAIRGEKGLLSVPAAAQLRLRWNPFFDYLETRSLAFMGLTWNPEG
jgi:alpha-beta hydrolase superfamily lysophospholipase